MFRAPLRWSWTAPLSMLACLLIAAAAVAYHGWEGPARSSSDRYFMVLAGRAGVFYDGSGPAVSIVIRATGARTRIDAVGIYADGNGRPVFGAVPAASYVELVKEPCDESDVLLRFEIARPEYERALTILRTWDRRAREGALLYPEIAMDNILLVKQVTESLNASTRRLALYSLDWGLADDISEHNLPPNIPFKYFQELRRINAGLHLRADDMPGLPSPAEPPAVP